ncbi:MAG: cytochrome b [Marinomonas sp.]
MSAASSSHYSRGAILLHWTTAIIVITMIGLIAFGSDNETPLGNQAVNLHKVLGIAVLGLTIVRLGWRLTHRPPALPSTMAPMLRILARVTHVLFYVVLLAMPLSGWWMTSAFPKRHPIDAGLFEIPFLPVTMSMESAGTAHSVHEAGALLITGLIVLHVAAALKHHFLNRDGVLQRMLSSSPR